MTQMERMIDMKREAMLNAIVALLAVLEPVSICLLAVNKPIIWSIIFAIAAAGVEIIILLRRPVISSDKELCETLSAADVSPEEYTAFACLHRVVAFIGTALISARFGFVIGIIFYVFTIIASTTVAMITLQIRIDRNNKGKAPADQSDVELIKIKINKDK